MNWARRSIGVVVALLPVALLISSIIAGMHGMRSSLPGGMAVMIAAALIGALNFYLSFLRGYFYLRRHGSAGNNRSDGYQHVSGFPMIGTVLVLIGATLAFGDIPTAVLGLCVMSLDTGGSVWFLISTWRDSSLWDA